MSLGYGLKSRYSATENVQYIATQMRIKVCNQITGTVGKISVLNDESITLSTKTTLIVYLKCETDKSSTPTFMFLDLLKISNQGADTITTALLKCLETYGFDNAYSRANLVAFASDGASVMVGRKSGVATKLTDLFPQLITWHCLNHRLEVAVSDAPLETQGINHFRSFMDCLFALYSRSPLAQTKLEIEAAELEVQFKKIGRVLSTRWVSSSYKTVSTVWRDYEALAAHFATRLNKYTKGIDDATKSKYSGLHKNLCSPQFVVDLGLMHDCLNELCVIACPAE